MKKIINNHRYDTDTAKKLASWDNGLPLNDFNYTEETLYQKRTGEYFLYGESGAAGHYCRSTADGWTGGGADIIPLTETEAAAWAQKHLSPAAYEDLFGANIAEDVLISERLKTLRAQTGLSQTAFADFIGVAYETYRCWEAEKRIPAPWAIRLIEYFVTHEFQK